MPVGALLGTAAANMGPNIAWLWTQRPAAVGRTIQPRLAAPPRRGPSVRRHGRLSACF